MIDTDRPHESRPYGWVVYAAAALRWLVRVLSANPGLGDERAAALAILHAGRNHPADRP